MAEHIIYEGKVNIRDKDKDGKPYTIKTGKSAGNNYCLLSFKVDGEWVNLADFSGKADDIADGQECKVAYSQRFDEFGDPALYNGKPQYNLEAIKAIGEVRSATRSDSPKGDYNAGLGAYQTALNCATQITSALVAAGKYLDVAVEGMPGLADVTTDILERAEHFHEYLVTGKADPLDQALAHADNKDDEEPKENFEF